MNLKLKGRIVERFGSQANFALVAKVDEPFLSRVVTGRRQLPEDEQERWCSLLGCKPAELFNGTQGGRG